ncbi:MULTISPECIES: hypothetical protein [unclassified Kribbella]|uniref:hypothetical protein n=1 Tax=unclassified Kribbella TaxID=2644121 RepID=UPI003018DBE7
MQTYTLPKKSLEAALSAQICSLSENSAEFCLVTMTGSDHAAWTPARDATVRRREQPRWMTGAPLRGSVRRFH